MFSLSENCHPIRNDWRTKIALHKPADGRTLKPFAGYDEEIPG